MLRMIWQHSSMTLLCSSTCIRDNIFLNSKYYLRLRFQDTTVWGRLSKSSSTFQGAVYNGLLAFTWNVCITLLQNIKDNAISTIFSIKFINFPDNTCQSHHTCYQKFNHIDQPLKTWKILISCHGYCLKIYHLFQFHCSTTCRTYRQESCGEFIRYATWLICNRLF